MDSSGFNLSSKGPLKHCTLSWYKNRLLVKPSPSQSPGTFTSQALNIGFCLQNTPGLV